MDDAARELRELFNHMPKPKSLGRWESSIRSRAARQWRHRLRPRSRRLGDSRAGRERNRRSDRRAPGKGAVSASPGARPTSDRKEQVWQCPRVPLVPPELRELRPAQTSPLGRRAISAIASGYIPPRVRGGMPWRSRFNAAKPDALITFRKPGRGSFLASSAEAGSAVFQWASRADRNPTC